MEPWMIYDIVAAALILLLFWLGYRRGFIASVLKLVAALVSLVAALILCRPAAQLLYDRLIRSRLVDYVDAKLLTADFTAGFTDHISELLEHFSDQGSGLFFSVGKMFENLPGLFGSAGQGSLSSAEQTLGQMMDAGASLAEAITAAALEPTVLLIIQSVLFLVLFTLFTMLLGIVIRLSGVFNHIPVIGALNRVVGGLLGGCEAVLALYILGVAAGLAIAAFGESDWFSVGILEETKLLSRIIYIKL